MTHNSLFVSHLLTRNCYDKFISLTQDLDAGGSGGTGAMSNFTIASTMPSPLFQDGPYTTNSMLEQSSAMSAPYIQGGFTDLILGVQQDATMSSSARKLHFDENM